MWQFLTGFGLGVYVGTFYDCRPAIKAVQILLKDNMPKEKGHFQEPLPEVVAEKKKSMWPFL